MEALLSCSEADGNLEDFRQLPCVPLWGGGSIDSVRAWD